MGRKRKDAGMNWLPPRCYVHGRQIIFRPAGGGCIKVAAATAAASEVWAAYEAIRAEDVKWTVKKMVAEFMRSADWEDLSTRTQKDYERHSKPLMRVFGAMEPSRVEPHHIRAYMDKRGLASRIQANREKAFFSRAFRWAFERGKVKKNPCTGVRQYKERARTRYVTDAEYQAVLAAARPAVRVAMELSYLCAARRGDVLKMRWSQVGEDGIDIQQSKTGARQIKLWSPRLRAIIAEAKKLSSNAIGIYVVVKPNGMPFTENGFSSAWQDAVAAARAATGWPLDFTFHDIKAKAISDVPGTSRDKQAVSGHKTEAQVATYDRSVKRVPAVDRLRDEG